MQHIFELLLSAAAGAVATKSIDFLPALMRLFQGLQEAPVVRSNASTPTEPTNSLQTEPTSFKRTKNGYTATFTFVEGPSRGTDPMHRS